MTAPTDGESPDEVSLGEELRQLLAAAFPDPEVRQHWLHRPSGALRGRTPIELVRAGREVRVCEVLASLEDGVFS